MTYKIQELEGVGEHLAERLIASGVRTTGDLLERCATAEGRLQLERATAIPGKQLLTWARQADLMRVPGVGSEFGQLLESSGTQNVTELGARNPENLVSVMARVNEEKHLTRVVPAVRTVSKWVDHARQLEPVLTR
jgi:predicted flap endonuclease-1-like 5' DNA nuclease